MRTLVTLDGVYQLTRFSIGHEMIRLDFVETRPGLMPYWLWGALVPQ